MKYDSAPGLNLVMWTRTKIGRYVQLFFCIESILFSKCMYNCTSKIAKNISASHSILWKFTNMVVDLDSDESEIIRNLESGSVINSGSGFLEICFLRCLDYLHCICIFHQQSGSKNVQVLKTAFFAMFRWSADLQFKCTVFFINNPDPDPKLRWKPDPIFFPGSTTLLTKQKCRRWCQ
jgi:hypothetical protein